jgi:hypothetical protein
VDVCRLSASLGGFDEDEAVFTDKNFPPRFNSMTSRLQAKIPKMFGWQLEPGHEFYLWHDGNLSLKEGVEEFLLNEIKGYDIVVLKHPDRNTIWWEYRYNWRGLNDNAPSNYLTERYRGEWLDEQIGVIVDDKDYIDDLLILGGLFLYRNTPEVQRMLKEWWYHVSRYLIMDQLSWAYVLKKSGVKYNALDIDYRELVNVKRHRKHG